LSISDFEEDVQPKFIYSFELLRRRLLLSRFLCVQVLITVARHNLVVMKSSNLIFRASLVALALAAPTDELSSRATTPKLYLAGDSTMALGGGGTGTQGLILPQLLIPKQALTNLRLGRLPPLFPHRHICNQRCQGRHLRTLLHKRRTLHSHHRRRRLRRFRDHRIRTQRRRLLDTH
jgi:hypothetical protein